jgi:hypothetical protein
VAVADHVIPAARVADLLIERAEGPGVLPEIAEDTPGADGQPAPISPVPARSVGAGAPSVAAAP